MHAITHSSFCVLNFALSACKPNVSENVRTAPRVQQASCRRKNYVSQGVLFTVHPCATSVSHRRLASAGHSAMAAAFGNTRREREGGGGLYNSNRDYDIYG